MNWFRIFCLLAVIVGVGFQALNMTILPFNPDLTFMLLPVFMGGGVFFLCLAIIALVAGYD